MLRVGEAVEEDVAEDDDWRIREIQNTMKEAAFAALYDIVLRVNCAMSSIVFVSNAEELRDIMSRQPRQP